MFGAHCQVPTQVLSSFMWECITLAHARLLSALLRNTGLASQMAGGSSIKTAFPSHPPRRGVKGLQSRFAAGGEPTPPQRELLPLSAMSRLASTSQDRQESLTMARAPCPRAVLLASGLTCHSWVACGQGRKEWSPLAASIRQLSPPDELPAAWGQFHL